ncbi:putative two-component system response regulator [Fluviicoccus keumensis]|uniref:Putative two-component system response regulator n=1 Tax=Fluviicoccus keumensis TaxID=1435465 RepID=A0A4Q7ZB73_9GAMM|nr:HD domain-containing phosphohydrolase [Fluviicoccus keumensis]RZU47852.1 putative two-component system response regulator [Fluviicoccus keumensis]
MTEPSLQHTVLIVDDMPDNIDILVNVLSPYYRVLAAAGGDKALQIAAGPARPDLILLDIMMPGLNGYQVCERLKADPETRGIPVIFVTAMGEVEDERLGLELGAVDYLVKPVSPALVLARVRTHLALYDQHRELARLVEQRTAELNKTRHLLIRRLARAAEYRDTETGNHIVRISHYARLLGRTLGMSPESVDTLFHAAPLHDVGKIGVPDSIMLKHGPLDPAEQEILNQHTTFGADIIGEQQDELLRAARLIALSHHEHWDGSGYPHGLKGVAIPLMARIVALADAFDDLTSDRPFHKSIPVAEAVRRIDQQAGSHFDPGLMEAFHKALPQLKQIREEFADGYGLVVIDSDLT